MTAIDAGQADATRGYRPPPRGGHYENVLLAVLFGTFGFVFFDRLALNYLTPYFKDELGLDNSHIGLLGGVPALAWAVSGLAIGYLSDRKDRRKPYLIAAIIVFTLFSAMSGLVGGIASLVLLRAVMGCAEGGVLPLAQPMMMYSSSPKRRGLNMGMVQGSSAGLIGGVLGPFVTVWLAESFGWRTAFYATVVPGVVLAVLVLVFVRDLRLREPATLAQDAADTAAPIHRGDPSMTFWQALRTRNVALCLVISVFYLTWFTTTQTFAPLYLSEIKGFSGGELSFVLSGIGIAWVIWGALVPGISDRTGRRPAMIVFSALAVFAPLAIVYVGSPSMLFAALIVTYTGMGCFTLMMATIPAETVPRHLIATCLGAIMGTGEIIGGFVAPWLAGLLSDSFGLQMSMLIPAGAAAIVVALSFGLVETAPSRTEEVR
ncbi:MFS transporter [Rhodococcus sp. 14-2496-1d]|uniref:MFS transporter n=1 Tax=unclassified Rhodococcus (in: high G+C Gram-positive bacteria) TaxID=192944 RepID=UPI000B9BDBF2|nr:MULTISPECIES: MFS transporter [unclassified Rhodococcus (in: high G+C Gram-positive bacteria)]OZE40064.1 MFS transporter [Rhodococcus sp. 05-2254-4]OZE44946.1 MFS transporter [Rhodococcus sp. 05-2254-6]OZE49632.1 MFS transporter [Rhodococcus sp. 05-2254-3]OZE50270.1 MFS transporter [Rhodococcus sp. 05-2254-2]OZF33310.1 MFS transporter [Rhodococcus sp. 14-2496-1d]